MRDAMIFAALLAVSGCLFVAGVALLSPAVALMVAGVLLAGLSWLMLGGDRGETT